MKAEATYRFAKALLEVGVETFQDLAKADLTELEQQIAHIPGQRSLISFSYFLMLSGDDSRIKPDRMVLRFLKEATGRDFSPSEALALLSEVVGLLKVDYPSLTARSLDHEIWKYAREQEAA